MVDNTPEQEDSAQFKMPNPMRLNPGPYVLPTPGTARAQYRLIANWICILGTAALAGLIAGDIRVSVLVFFVMRWVAFMRFG